MRSAGSPPLSRKPLAPASSAPKTYSSSSNVVSTKTRVRLSAGSVVMRRVASSPSISGMRMSITTTSGFSARTCSSACAPVAASPTTSMSSRESSSARNPARTIGWSSASTTLVGVIDRLTAAQRKHGVDAPATFLAGADVEAAAEGRSTFEHAAETKAGFDARACRRGRRR